MSTYKKTDHVAVMSFSNNPNIGLYAFANDKVCLLGMEVPDKEADEISEILKVPVHKISIAGTSLIGVFCAGNSNCIMVPSIIQKSEEEELRMLDIPYKILPTKMTALGNNISSNDSGAVVSPDFSESEIRMISDHLGVPTKKGKISELNNLGSCLKVNSKGGLIHREVKDSELKFMQDVLGVEILDGTVNMGNPYVSSGIIANSNGFIIGGQSGGPEITNADTAFGFIE